WRAAEGRSATRGAAPARVAVVVGRAERPEPRHRQARTASRQTAVGGLSGGVSEAERRSEVLEQLRTHERIEAGVERAIVRRAFTPTARRGCGAGRHTAESAIGLVELVA